jgi:hypothetical protein
MLDCSQASSFINETMSCKGPHGFYPFRAESTLQAHEDSISSMLYPVDASCCTKVTAQFKGEKELCREVCSVAFWMRNKRALVCTAHMTLPLSLTLALFGVA